MHFLFIPAVFAATVSFPQSQQLTRIKSAHPFDITVKQVEHVLNEKNMHIFLQTDHAKGAENVGTELRPTHLFIFGNPKVGTKLMQCDQRVGIELPLKILIWEDTGNEVWIGYHNPLRLAENYDLQECSGVLQKVNEALAGISKTASSN